jgi:3-methyl-2-oxobutanoate hydroxymethyltransferase
MATVRDLRDMEGESPITMTTAYDTVTARLVDEAGVDVILVGDSMGNTVLGYNNTLPVTVDEMASHTGAVTRGTEEALVVADMPFLSVGANRAQAIKHCGRMLKEEGASAVKIESGPHTVSLTERLTNLGVPVMAHVGLTPQSVHQTGYQRQGTDSEEAREIISLVRDHAKAGAFACVLEHIPANLASRITEYVDIPTIGIGAGPDCDGQVLVVNDIVGMSNNRPPFAKAFGDVRSEIENSLENFVDAVKSEEFPNAEHSPDEEQFDESTF